MRPTLLPPPSYSSATPTDALQTHIANKSPIVVTGYGKEGQDLGSALVERVNTYNLTHPVANLTVSFSDGKFTVKGSGKLGPEAEQKALQSILLSINNDPKFKYWRLSLDVQKTSIEGWSILILPEIDGQMLGAESGTISDPVWWQHEEVQISYKKNDPSAYGRKFENPQNLRDLINSSRTDPSQFTPHSIRTIELFIIHDITRG
jgi:hypothetical protein